MARLGNETSLVLKLAAARTAAGKLTRVQKLLDNHMVGLGVCKEDAFKAGFLAGVLYYDDELRSIVVEQEQR